jgi:DNA primase
MGQINREIIEEVRAAANIVDVVGSYVSLRKRGKNYLGLCPFHGEKEPSFTVSDEKQIFHCFGCGASGSVFDFLMRSRNLSFAEAVKELANRFSIPLPQRQETGQAGRMRELAERLHRVNELAATYYNQVLLDKSTGKMALAYLQSRGMGPEVIEDFQLGYAPQSWDGLKRHLLSRKVDLTTAVQAGLLVKKSERDCYDRFRHRLMFPIQDMRGRTVGFGGRALDEENPPKYLNSPETPIFHKGRTLYGLATAREACRRHKEALVVEGYFDLLALYNQGIKQVVAPLGTALTLHHVRLLRSLELFLREKLPARLLALPEGMDPDDFLAREGREPFTLLLEKARPLMEIFLEQSLADYDGSVEGRLKVVRQVTPMLKLLDSRVTQEGYVRMLDQRLGVSEEVLRAELGMDSTSRRITARGPEPDRAARIPAWEEEIVRILIHYPTWIPLLEESSALNDFQVNPWVEVAGLLTKYYQEGGNLALSGLLMDLEDEDLKNVISAWSLESSPWREDEAHARLRDYLEGIGSRRRQLQDELKRLKEEIRAAERSQNQTRIAELLAELQAKKAALLAKDSNDKANLSKGEMV